MDAPTYPPSIAWEAPVKVPQPLSTRDSSLQEFLDDPVAKAIIGEEVKGFETRISNPMLKPHLGNMSPRSMVQFGLFKADALDRVDARLKDYYAKNGVFK